MRRGSVCGVAVQLVGSVGGVALSTAICEFFPSVELSGARCIPRCTERVGIGCLSRQQGLGITTNVARPWHLGCDFYAQRLTEK